jgi:Holliday junction resolvasome RuvABC endonuclease subunit
MPRRDPTILAIDPGTREFGFAVLAGRRLLVHGAVSLRHLERARRLDGIRRRIRVLAATHAPSTIVVEKTYRHPVPWLDRLDAITRTARAIARRRRLRFAAYAPQAVRLTVAGSGRASKLEAAQAVAHRFPQLRLYLTQDRRWKERLWRNMFDAVALALHHASVTQPPSRSRSSG